MICYAFATAHEGAELVAQMTGAESFDLDGLGCVVGKLNERTILVATIGMGLTHAAINTQQIFDHFRLKALILAGYGGALVPQLKHGQVFISDNFTHDELKHFVRLLPGFNFANFCSTDEVVATPERKAEYAEATKCQIVDMETAAVAEIVVGREIPFIAIRGISDEFTARLPSAALAAGFDAALNRPTPLKLVCHLLRHPAEIAPFKKFVQGLPLVRSRITRLLLQLTKELPSNW
jgi:adenosylhomocysteine nucleosidase